jgi:hypothetical protein
MVRVESLGNPFNELYMVSEGLDGSTARLNRENIVNLIANAIQLNSVSEIGPALDAQLANIKHEMHQCFEHPTTKNKYIQAYSSIGLRGLYYPVREIKHICSMKYALDVANSFLIKSGSNLEQNVRDLIHDVEINLTIDNLLELLGIEVDIGNPNFSPENKDTADILEEWKGSNIARLNDYECRLQEIIEETKIQTKASLDKEIANILNNPINGMDTVLQLYESLSKHIDTQLGSLSTEIGELQVKSNKRDEEAASIMQNIRKLIAGTVVPLKGHRINTKKEDFTFVMRCYFDILIEIKKREKAHSYLKSIKEILAKDNLKYLGVKSKIVQLADNLEKKITLSVKDLENGRVDNTNDLFKILANAIDEVDFYYLQFQTPIIDKRGEIYRQKLIGNWFDLNSDQIRDIIYDFSREEYENISFDMGHAIHNLDYTIQELYRETHISMKFSGQKWGFNHHILPTLCFLGVPEKLVPDISKSVRTLPTQNVQIVPLKEENKIFFALYKYAIPLIAMSPILRIKNDYDQLKDGPIPLNIFKIEQLPTLGE